MGKNAAKSIAESLEIWRSLAAAEGLLVPEKRLESGVYTEFETPVDSHLVPDPILDGKRAYLGGNLARRKLPIADGDGVIWDTDLPGFGLRLRPSGRHTWFVRIRHRDKHKRFHLGRVEDVDVVTARAQARRMLAEVALDGLPQPVAQKLAPLFSTYVEEFWRDYAHHWKLSTQVRNRNAVRHDILPYFGWMRLPAHRLGRQQEPPRKSVCGGDRRWAQIAQTIGLVPGFCRPAFECSVEATISRGAGGDDTDCLRDRKLLPNCPTRKRARRHSKRASEPTPRHGTPPR